MDAGRFGRMDQSIHIILFGPECDIGTQRIGKEKIVLRHIGNILTKFPDRNLVNIPAVNIDHARFRVVQMK